MTAGVADASKAPGRADRERVMGAPASAAAGRLDVRAGRLKVAAGQRGARRPVGVPRRGR